MDIPTYLIVIVIVLIVFFVPFYPFRLVKRFAFLLLNTFVPLPIKFDDIGGAPIVGIRLFNVRLAMGGQSTLKAGEMRLRINLWRMLLLQRPSVDPVSFHNAEVHLYKQEKGDAEVSFLSPLTVVKWLVGFLVSNLAGLSKVVFVNSEIVIHGRKGDTRITALSGKFLARGPAAAVRSMACRIGDGTIELTPVSRRQNSDVRVTVRELPLDELVAMKVPKHMTGAVKIDAMMTGGFGAPVVEGEMYSSCIYLRGQPIRNFHSKLRYEGNLLSLDPMLGNIGDYVVTGSMAADIVTDKVRLKLHGTGKGHGAGEIFKMINMNPYITSGEIDVRIDLDGDFEIFDDISGEIIVRLKDARINPEAIVKTADPGKSKPRVPILNFDLYMQDGSLFTDSIDAWLPGSRLHLDGRIDMKLDEAIEKVTETYYDLAFFARNDETVPDTAQWRGALKSPFEFDGKFKLRTHQRLDPSEFEAGGSLEMNNIRILSRMFGRFEKILSFIELYFHGIRGDLDITAKRLLLSNARLSGLWFDVELNGRVDFSGGLDLIASVSRPHKSAAKQRMPALPSWLTDYLNPTLHITGTLNAPKIKLKKRGDAFIMPDSIRRLRAGEKAEEEDD